MKIAYRTFGAVFSVLFSLFALANKPNLQAEVENVVLTWDSVICQGSCIGSLQNQLVRIPGVSQVQFTPAYGQAVLQWVPYAPFNYYSILNAFKMVGLYLADIRVKVRGTIQYNANAYYLVSLGDQTAFMLLAPVGYTPGQAAVYNSIYNRTIQPNSALSTQLLQAAQTSQIVEIEGPLFEPWRSSYPQLIAQIMRIVQTQPSYVPPSYTNQQQYLQPYQYRQ